jgi:hypothetical protein
VSSEEFLTNYQLRVCILMRTGESRENEGIDSSSHKHEWSFVEVPPWDQRRSRLHVRNSGVVSIPAITYNDKRKVVSERGKAV